MGKAQASHEAIREAFSSLQGVRATTEINAWIQQQYPNRWEPSTISAHLYGGSVNSAKAYKHHPHIPKFIFTQGNGRYELYDTDKHGEYIHGVPQDETTELEEELTEVTADETIAAVEASLTLERDLENFLVQDIGRVEGGLRLFQYQGKLGKQFETPVGILDLLCEDANGQLVVIELKAGQARDSAVGQISGYIGWIRKNVADGKNVRGILVAQDFTDRVRFGAAAIGISLLRYRVKFSFEPCDTDNGK
jgi:endonuclease